MRDALLAQIILIEYLRRSPGGRTAREILAHLHAQSEWGRTQLRKGSGDHGLRVLQGWLMALRDSTDLEGLLIAETDPNDARRLRYRLRIDTRSCSSLPIEEAALLALAEHHLRKALPETFRVNALDAVFRRARSTIERHESSLDPARPAIARYVQSIVAVSRGQSLTDGAVRSRRIDTVLSALLSRRCLRGRYRNRERQLHVCGLVLRDPKLYLVAIDDDPDTQTVCSVPKVFALDRFESLTLSQKHSRSPVVDLDAFVEAGNLEAPARGRSPSGGPEPIDLVLRVHDLDTTGDSALLSDLRAYPLSPEQTVVQVEHSGTATVRCPGLPATEALVCWILGRADRVEVVEPVWLRVEVGRRVNAVQRRYAA